LCRLRESLGLDRTAQVIVCVARLRWEKGVDVLIDAMKHLSDLPHLHLVVIGNGPAEDTLKGQAARAGTNIHFPGFQDDVHAWLAMADIVAMPSRRESFGRVTLEAMAAGRPIVATRTGGIPEGIVDGESGLLVPPDDARALAGALRALATEPDRAERLGAAARQRYESCYTIEHMATSWRLGWERALIPARRP
jgi:glycosyltransferase involved in cell wall biosynthesis